MSAAARLCAFLLLLVAVLAVAYAAGARVGPITHRPASTATPAPASPGGGGRMGEMP